MEFSKEQTEEIKKQLISNIELQDFPAEKKEQLREYINSLNEQQLKEFLKQNKIQLSSSGLESKSPSDSSESTSPQCIFCSITQGKVPSYKIAENSKAISILEINPLSKGHSLVIPLEHNSMEKIPKSAMTLAQKILKKIKSKLKPEDIKIETTNIMGHSIINIIPLYKDQQLEKKQVEENELKKLQSKLETKKRAPRKKKEKTEKKLPEISFRIP